MKIDELVAIDVHTHAEISCREPEDDYASDIEEQKRKYFKTGTPPTILETVALYRKLKIGLVMFTVDTEFEIGRRRVPNEEVVEAAAANSDIMLAFGSVDPHKGKMGLREVKRLIDDHKIGGFKFHPTCQGFYPNDRMAYPLYEVMEELGVPALFHTGQTGIGAGLPGGGGIRLKYSDPLLVDDVAVDFPELRIILAHPSFPWQDEALAVATHKPHVYIDLSGWSPKYFPPQLVRYANSLLKDKVLFGSDYPLISPDRWLADFAELEIKPEVRPKILKDNAVRLLGLAVDEKEES